MMMRRMTGKVKLTQAQERQQREGSRQPGNNFVYDYCHRDDDDGDDSNDIDSNNACTLGIYGNDFDYCNANVKNNADEKNNNDDNDDDNLESTMVSSGGDHTTIGSACQHL